MPLDFVPIDSMLHCTTNGTSAPVPLLFGPHRLNRASQPGAPLANEASPPISASAAGAGVTGGSEGATSVGAVEQTPPREGGFPTGAESAPASVNEYLDDDDDDEEKLMQQALALSLEGSQGGGGEGGGSGDAGDAEAAEQDEQG